MPMDALIQVNSQCPYSPTLATAQFRRVSGFRPVTRRYIFPTFPARRKMNMITGMLLATVLALTGGGGSSPSATALPTATATSVSGTAAKGIVKQAKVLVCRIVNGVPEPDASCASTITGNDGSYGVSLGDGFNGPAMVKVMAGTASTMMDEKTGKEPPYNMTMPGVGPRPGKARPV